jgi:hypothetical protein
MEKHWTFRAFKHGGVNIADAWLDSLPTEIEENFRALLARMAVIRIWEGKYFKALKGHTNLYEIKLSGTVYRLLGCYGTNRGEFILLMGATKEPVAKLSISSLH